MQERDVIGSVRMCECVYVCVWQTGEGTESVAILNQVVGEDDM